MSRLPIAAALLAALCAPSAFAGSDNFNRAALGLDWYDYMGTLFIKNNELQGTSQAAGFFQQDMFSEIATVKVSLHGTSPQYGAIVVGDDLSMSYFVKVQTQNGTGLFDHVAFYTENNWDGTFVTMTRPMASPVTMRLVMVGAMAILSLQNSSDSQSYTYVYPTAEYGFTGLGTFGSVSLDNFSSPIGSAVATAKEAANQAAMQSVRVVGSNDIDLSR